MTKAHDNCLSFSKTCIFMIDLLNPRNTFKLNMVIEKFTKLRILILKFLIDT